jgi:predicted RNA binding protein YcfA (HicA-like mRNA interferase family)
MVSISCLERYSLAKLEKRIRKLYDSPRNISDRELISILEMLGFEERGGKGSHTVYKHPKLPHTLITVPDQNPLKVSYIVQARKILSELLELLENEE